MLPAVQKSGCLYQRGYLPENVSSSPDSCPTMVELPNAGAATLAKPDRCGRDATWMPRKPRECLTKVGIAPLVGDIPKRAKSFIELEVFSAA